MKDPRIQKRPRWAQAYIAELEQRADDAEQYADALRVMIDGSPEIEKDVHPTDDFQTITNGWLAYRQQGYNQTRPIVEKACTSSIYHSVGQWDKTRSQNPISMYSSPSLALRSLLPQILKSYADEIAATLQKIKEYEL